MSFEEDRDKFSRTLIKSAAVVLILSRLGTLKTAEYTVVSDNIVSSIHEAAAKDMGIIHGHPGMAGEKVARLIERRVKTVKS